MKKNTGITLIALIVTVIVLLVLAGIVLSLTIDQNGIINRAKEAGVTYDEKQAEEKLNLVLLDMQADKVTNPNYNENEYLTEKIVEQGMIVNGDIVLVDGWQFQIDRSVPKIEMSLGKGKTNEKIQIGARQEVSENYVKSLVIFEIIYEGEIASIQINGENVAIPEKQDGKYILEKETYQNGIVTILAKDKQNTYQVSSIQVTEITQNIEIWTKEDLETFRDSVNIGRTYQGKNVSIMADIDLQSEEWLPIGKDENIVFEGTLNGNYHKINNLSIQESELLHVGLFSMVGENASILNLQIANCKIKNHSKQELQRTGAICGENRGKIVNCSVRGIVESNTTISAPVQTGGICGFNTNQIIGCKNVADICTIKSTADTSSNGYAAGIVGYNSGGIVSACYNVGNVYTKAAHARSAGICGFSGLDTAVVEKCYNTGNISGSGSKTAYIAGIIASRGNTKIKELGEIRDNYMLDSSATYSYYYYTSSFKTSKEGRVDAQTLKDLPSALQTDYMVDELFVNQGYPRLKWENER